jgi:hypothetical protein
MHIKTNPNIMQKSIITKTKLKDETKEIVHDQVNDAVKPLTKINAKIKVQKVQGKEYYLRTEIDDHIKEVQKQVVEGVTNYIMNKTLNLNLLEKSVQRYASPSSREDSFQRSDVVDYVKQQLSGLEKVDKDTAARLQYEQSTKLYFDRLKRRGQTRG